MFQFVMPDLIRHSQPIETTGFRVKPGMTKTSISDLFTRPSKITVIKYSSWAITCRPYHMRPHLIITRLDVIIFLTKNAFKFTIQISEFVHSTFSFHVVQFQKTTKGKSNGKVC